MSWRASVLVGLAGAALVMVLVATAETEMMGDSVGLIQTAVLPAILVGLVGVGALWFARSRAVQVQAVIVALTAIAAMAAGIVAVSSSMFLSPHDLDVVVVVLAASATIAVLLAMELGRRVGRASRSLGALTRRIGEGEGAVDRVDAPETAELAELGAALADMSDRLDVARAREREAESARRDLIAWASHDLRTPLARIRVLIEALEDGVIDESASVERAHASIRRETERLGGLVGGLFELSSIHAGAVGEGRTPVTVEDLISDAVAAASPASETFGISLTGEVDAPMLVDVSVPEISRVLQNLLDNAIRHTPEGGQVDVCARRSDDLALIEVVDDGDGFDDEALERAFEMGFTGDPARTPTGHQGSGLGLAIARGLVEANGGTIAIANGSGGGIVRVELPLVAGDEADDSSGDEDEADGEIAESGQGPEVDDDADVEAATASTDPAAASARGQ